MKYNLLLYFLSSVLASYRIHVLETPILDFLPNLKLHHVVILEKDNRVYAVDFTPTGKRDFKTVARLLLGFSEPAEIRFLPITNVDFADKKALIKKWENIRDIKPGKYAKLDKNKKEIVNLLKDWKNDSVNMYCHNCQHFSHFVKRKVFTKNS